LNIISVDLDELSSIQVSEMGRQYYVTDLHGFSPSFQFST